jgi:hypothetical protein
MDTGHNPNPHAEPITTGSPRPAPGSIREPSRSFKIGSLLVGVTLLGFLGYQCLWGGTAKTPDAYCAGLRELSGAVQQAQSGGITRRDLLSQLASAEADLRAVGEMDAASVGSQVQLAAGTLANDAGAVRDALARGQTVDRAIQVGLPYDSDLLAGELGSC